MKWKNLYQMNYLLNIKLMFRIEYSKKVIQDFESISSFISLDNPVYSIKTINSILNTIDLLKDFPYLWKEVDINLRELIEKKYKYKITYQIQENKIIILSTYKYKNSWK